MHGVYVKLDYFIAPFLVSKIRSQNLNVFGVFSKNIRIKIVLGIYSKNYREINSFWNLIQKLYFL